MKLARLAGACRYVWNWALARRTRAYRAEGTRVNWIELSREFTALKGQPETAWLAALPREPFNQVLRDQERAFANFFGHRASYPRFRRRGGKLAMRFTLDQRREQLDQGTRRWAWVRLPGVGCLKLRRTEALDGRLRNVTLSRDAAGHWYASLAADGVPTEPSVAPSMSASARLPCCRTVAGSRRAAHSKRSNGACAATSASTSAGVTPPPERKDLIRPNRYPRVRAWLCLIVRGVPNGASGGCMRARFRFDGTSCMR
jgi:hypothetical protein